MTGTANKTNGNSRNGRSWMGRLRRNMRYRLVIPIQRSIHPPEHTARGVAVGLAWGLTPTVGVQMIFVFLCWVVARRWAKWDFSLIIALAWTWTTNVITLFPCYYLFYMTGQVLLGRFDDLTGYGEFMNLWDSNVAADADLSYWEWLWTYTVVLIKGWGLPMLIGCLPWAALGSWAGYVWSLRFVRRYRSARSRRRAEKAGTAAATADSKP